ncbi:MAG: class I SAM-dependent DNA methyltransferase [Thermoplasmata archaeon]
MTPGPGSETPYGRLAEVYDRVYSWKDYAREARIVRSIARRWGPRGARTLLDVACGTGAHLRHLARWYECTGLDPSSAMLAVARRNVPGVRFVRGRMPSFELHRRFDVITCLFSAIGYVPDVAALRRTARTFAHHLAPGGVAIVEPWLTPEVWKPGGAHLLTVPSRERPIARMNLSVTRQGRSVMDMHYLVAGKDRIDHWVERHDLGLFSTQTMTSAFRAAGLRVRRVPSGFYRSGRSDRGLYVATLPVPIG